MRNVLFSAAVQFFYSASKLSKVTSEVVYSIISYVHSNAPVLCGVTAVSFFFSLREEEYCYLFSFMVEPRKPLIRENEGEMKPEHINQLFKKFQVIDWP